MKVDMRKAPDFDQLQCGTWDIAFCGDSLDDRGQAALDKITSNSGRVIHLVYNSRDFKIAIDGVSIHADDFAQHIAALACSHPAIEATTLGFAEILLCCKAFAQHHVISFDVLYVEPAVYRSPRRRELLDRRDFELSGLVPGYRAIPGSAMHLTDYSKHRAVFFLGYEERRLDRAFEDFQMIQAANTAVVFGVPAFKPGWEMDAMANNITVIREKNIRGGVYFCAAESPVAAMDVLDELHAALQSGERLLVGPIGTKPNGVGVALFASSHPDIRVLYDHPERSPGRTQQVDNWHLYQVDNH